MGARDLEEISEDEVFDEFVDALGLKPLEKRRLRKALAAAAPPAPADAAAAPSLSKAPSLVAVPGAPSTHTVFVKNTFLDLQEPPRLSDLRRLNTAPAPEVAFEDDEAEPAAEDEEEDEAEEPGDPPADSEGGGAEGGRSPAPPDGLYKMATYDGYDSWEEWNWLTSGGDPNSHASVGQGCTLVPMDRFTRWPDGMGVDDGSYGPGPEKKEREQALQKAFSVASRISRVRWTVDARRLKSKDREAASPTFELSCGSPMEFKMVIHPRKVEDARGGASFKKAQGKGTVQLRILSRVEDSASAVVTFRLAVGSSSKQSEPRGPVRHDFSEKPICGLPEGRDEWDFQKAVDKTTQTFVVCLEVLMGTAE